MCCFHLLCYITLAKCVFNRIHNVCKLSGSPLTEGWGLKHIVCGKAGLIVLIAFRATIEIKKAWLWLWWRPNMSIRNENNTLYCKLGECTHSWRDSVYQAFRHAQLRHSSAGNFASLPLCLIIHHNTASAWHLLGQPISPHHSHKMGTRVSDHTLCNCSFRLPKQTCCYLLGGPCRW